MSATGQSHRGDVRHRALVAHRDHQGLLMILVAVHADAGEGPYPGMGTVGADHQARVNLLAVVQAHRRLVPVLVDAVDAMAGDQGDGRLGLRRLPFGAIGPGRASNRAVNRSYTRHALREKGVDMRAQFSRQAHVW